VIHSSYKSLLVAFAVTALGVSGCAIAPESEPTQESSSDLTIERSDLQPQVPTTTIATVTPTTEQNAIVHPTVPRMLVLDGPKPNPWDDNGTNNNTGGSGTGTGSNSK